MTRGRYQEHQLSGSALVGGSALLGAPIASGESALLGPTGPDSGVPMDGTQQQRQAGPVGGHEDENGIDDSAAFNAELDRIAAEKEQVCRLLLLGIQGNALVNKGNLVYLTRRTELT